MKKTFKSILAAVLTMCFLLSVQQTGASKWTCRDCGFSMNTPPEIGLKSPGSGE